MYGLYVFQVVWVTAIPAVCLSLDFLMEICESSGGDQTMLKMDHSLRKPIVMDSFLKIVKSPVDLHKGGACKKRINDISCKERRQTFLSD